MAKDLAETLAEDLAVLGLAELVSPGSLKALNGNTLVEIEQDNDLISVYENGELLKDFATTDPQFNESFLATLATSLNF